MVKNFREGKFVNIRDIEEKDAEFVLSLRCDKKKSQFLHKTDPDIQKQINYIRHYKTLDNEWYFIIENKEGKPIGTYRIYDLRQDSFCIGSWLMTDNSSLNEVIEGEYLSKIFAFETTGFNKFHFDVRKNNKKVMRFHKLMGAKIVSEDEIDYFFECTKEDYLRNVRSYLHQS
ncbi:MAG: GNAT family N-acetyltransferase [Candidatus Avigastranaerophilus sp.]